MLERIDGLLRLIYMRNLLTGSIAVALAARSIILNLFSSKLESGVHPVEEKK